MRARDEARPAAGSTEQGEQPRDPIHILADGFLCRLMIWSDAEWEALPSADRPLRARRLEGLGWVGAVPEINMN
jgi:hypothetical protein